MNYSLILARDFDNVIALDGKIPWMGRYPQDLKNFKMLTLGHTIIMGRKTYESFRKPLTGKPYLLPGRISVVITRNTDVANEVRSLGGLAFHTINDMHKNLPMGELFVIGGTELYKSMKHLISKVYLTIIPEHSLKEAKYVNPQHDYDVTLFEDFQREVASNVYKKPLDGLDYHVITINRPDMQYLELIKKISQSTNIIHPTKDRTGIGYKALYGEMLKFDISGLKIPITTIRYQPFKSIVEELLWFMKGQTDAGVLQSKNVKVWNGNTSAEFLKKRKLEYPENIAGPIYGFQWRNWGADYNNPESKGIDQLLNVINGLKNTDTRYDRRHIISAWNVADLNKMALPPCHVLYQFNVDSNDVIHTTFYQRSSDVALASSWNATSAAILTHIIAKLSGLTSGTLTMFISNAHLYNNHEQTVQEIFNRKAYDFPTISIDIDMTSKELSELISALDISCFKLHNYYFHPAIELQMNV